MATSFLHLPGEIRREEKQDKHSRNFKQSKNREDGSDLDGFWINRIAVMPAKFALKIVQSKQKFASGKTLKKFAESLKKLSWFSVSDEKQNSNGHIKKARL